MKIIESVIELGMPLQINTTVGRLTYPHLPAMIARVRELPIALWAVFFLIATGRGTSLDQLTAEECEQVLRDLHDLSRRVPFGIKTTEAPHYHRVMAQRGARAPAADAAPARPHAQIRAGRAVTDGNGFVFIDHLGQICPSGFLPAVCGSVRTESLVDVYREHETFLRLRDPDRFEGKCGRCEFRHLCGGSRARAYSATGSPYGSDPLCPYVPEGGM
jgi:radical SAM protein with 4Fe4S-binding SPASM domain